MEEALQALEDLMLGAMAVLPFLDAIAKYLGQQGVPVMRLAVRGWDDAAPDPQDQDEKSRTQYLLQGGVREASSGLVA